MHSSYKTTLTLIICSFFMCFFFFILCAVLCPQENIIFLYDRRMSIGWIWACAWTNLYVYFLYYCAIHIYIYIYMDIIQSLILSLRCSLHIAYCFERSTQEMAGNLFLFLFCGRSEFISMCSVFSDFVNQLCMFHLIFRNIFCGREKNVEFFCCFFMLFLNFFGWENDYWFHLIQSCFVKKCRKTFYQSIMHALLGQNQHIWTEFETWVCFSAIAIDYI